jgi:hypothetical protein
VKSSHRIYKEKRTDKTWWVDNSDVKGEFLFTFDKKKFYNLFADYPDKLSVREWIVFNAENPYWKEFFEERNDEYETKHLEEIEGF